MQIDLLKFRKPTDLFDACRCSYAYDAWPGPFVLRCLRGQGHPGNCEVGNAIPQPDPRAAKP